MDGQGRDVPQPDEFCERHIPSRPAPHLLSCPQVWQLHMWLAEQKLGNAPSREWRVVLETPSEREQEEAQAGGGRGAGAGTGEGLEAEY